MSPVAGTVVANRYRLDRPLGEGGMGEVWQATHVVTGRVVALKRLRPGRGDDSEPRARARFMLEARAACAVEHPNVVQILDFVEGDGEPPMIVMELLRGETLADELARSHALSLERSAELLIQVVSSVGMAHSLGIVHRDLKPANLFIAQGAGAPVMKVLDFGIAKWMAPRGGLPQPRTQTGSSLGTPCYMAPEQALGEPRVDHRADIWALGVIWYECLSGCRPIEGENAAGIMVRLLSSGIMPVEKLVPDVPGVVSALIARMLAREPSLRPADLREVSRVLGSLTRTRAPEFDAPHSSLGPSGSGEQERPLFPAALPDPKTPEPVAARLPPSSRRSRSLAAAIASATVVLGGGLIGLRASAEDPQSGGGAGTAPPTLSVSAAAPLASQRFDGPGSLLRVPSVLTAGGAERGASEIAKPAGNATARRAAPRKLPALEGAPSSAAASAGLPAGAQCERSRECMSGACLALACQ